MRPTKSFLLFLMSAVAWAQTHTATVRGIVTDHTGAVIGGATVHLKNLDQNRDALSRTNQNGEYVFVQAQPGAYSLSVETPGFKIYQRHGLALEVAQVAEIDVTMELGAVTESIEITAQAPLLESASSTLGEVVNGKTAEDLPLNGRNSLQLVALTPGINTTRSFRTANTSDGSIAAVAFSANGGRNVSNEIMLDGSPQVVMGYNQPAYVPTPDALQEFKVQTNNLSAEYGRTGGAVVNLVHRSGTKDFHGVLYEFLRNDALDANGFFNNKAGKDKAPFRYNQYGFTVGGPLTKSRNSTFFFVNWEGIREINPGDSTFTVPTLKMRQGDFTGTGTTIYDPTTVNSAGIRQPFPGNAIPSNRFNPVATKLLSYYPEPNLPGISNNFFSQQGTRRSSANISTKIDRRISDRQNLFGRFSWNNFDTNLANYFGNVASPNFGIDGGRNHSFTLDDTYLAGGWVLHGNFGYAYAANPRNSAVTDFDLTTLGLPAALKNAAQFQIFPRIEPAGQAALGGDPTFVIGNRFDTATWSADATRLIHAHTIKFGGTYRLNRVSNFRPNSPAGLYSFNESFTRDSINSNRGGHTVASMLLGLLSGGRMQYEPALADEVRYGGVYFQDDWRVNGRLTVNLGLRWDTDRPLTERFNRTSSFDFNAPLPIQVPSLGPLHGGLVFAGRDGHPRGNKDPDNNNFAPRIGIAYKLTDRLVLRSGFGVFYNPTTGIGPGTASTGALSFNAVTNITSTIDGGRTPFTTLSNPFPDGLNRPTNGNDGLLTFLGQNIDAQVRGDRVPYSMQWNFDAQYELPGEMLLDAAYAGNAGVRLQAQAQINQLPDRYLALGDDLNKTVPNPFFGITPATSSLGQPTITRGQLLRPYPQFTGVTEQWTSLAHSSYHSLQFKFRKRYRSGLQLLAAYTWAKMIDDYSSVAGFLGQQNPGFTNNNRRDLDKSISSLDVAHRLVFNYQYELPFGAGKAFLNRKGPLNILAGGWSLNGVSTLQSGLPISIGSAADTTNSFGGNQRPNSTGRKSETPGGVKQRLDRYFDPGAFENAPKYTFGNVGRFLPDNRGPALHVHDLSILKNFPIGEKRRLEYRAEFFNVLNQVNFISPSGDGTTFGRPQFGTITDAERARIIQMGLKLYF